MKIGIVGSGLVGSTAAYAIVLRGIAREVVLVDLNQVRAQAEADDILHAVPFAHPVDVHAGDYPGLAGSRVVILTAGVSQKPGESRMQLLERNSAIFRQIVPNVLQHAPEAILLVTTNPVDVMTHLTAHIASEYGIPSSRVIGSGTTLDTARFRALLGRHLEIDPQHIHAYVLGEHGDSEVLAWSQVGIGGIPLADFCEIRHRQLCDEKLQEIDGAVRKAAYRIIEGKGATYYGIGSALARIVEVILRDQRSILTLCTPVREIAGVTDVTVSLPNLLGGSGVLETFRLCLSESEMEALQASAMIVKQAIQSLP
jgi:L-lactate dehydrogenase